MDQLKQLQRKKSFNISKYTALYQK